MDEKVKSLISSVSRVWISSRCALHVSYICSINWALTCEASVTPQNFPITKPEHRLMATGLLRVKGIITIKLIELMAFHCNNFIINSYSFYSIESEFLCKESCKIDRQIISSAENSSSSRLKQYRIASRSNFYNICKNKQQRKFCNK